MGIGKLLEKLDKTLAGAGGGWLPVMDQIYIYISTTKSGCIFLILKTCRAEGVSIRVNIGFHHFHVKIPGTFCRGSFVLRAFNDL